MTHLTKSLSTLTRSLKPKPAYGLKYYGPVEEAKAKERMAQGQSEGGRGHIKKLYPETGGEFAKVRRDERESRPESRYWKTGFAFLLCGTFGFGFFREI